MPQLMVPQGLRIFVPGYKRPGMLYCLKDIVLLFVSTMIARLRIYFINFLYDISVEFILVIVLINSDEFVVLFPVLHLS